MLTTFRYFTALACFALPDPVIGLAIAEASRAPRATRHQRNTRSQGNSRIDLAATLLVIRTANGTEETVKFVQCRPYQPNRSVASPDLSA
jgi:hypothetical protein